MAKVTFQNEVGENCLFERGWMPVEEAPRGRKRFHEAFGKNDEAQSQRVEQHLGECPDVDDAAGPVQTLQGWHRRPGIAVLGVVLVFNDPRILAGRPIEQFGAAARRHGDAERKLIRGRNVSQPGVGLLAPGLFDDQSFLIDRHRDDSGARGAKSKQGAGIAGIFHPDRIAGIEEQAGHKVEPLLRARGDR